MVDFDRLAIAIATHHRPAQLQALARTWAETAPAYREMRVIVSHPDGVAGFEPPARCAVTRLDWPPGHHGCMAKMWNLAMLWGFRDPEVEWLLCSMDDLEVLPGWPAVLETYSADLYLAPAGDVGFLFNREVLRQVGWFDERFSVIGYQEWDWQARVIRALGVSRVSIEDAHGWRHNPVDLAKYWAHNSSAGGRQRNFQFERMNAAWLTEKWGGPDPLKGMLGSGVIPEPKIPEIEWYPWFSREAT